LGFDCAEAVVRYESDSNLSISDCPLSRQTSFEFKKGRAFPVISGVVIAVENEEALLEVGFLRIYLSCLLIAYATRRTGKLSATMKRRSVRNDQNVH
jgi:hypothetical protein